MRVRYDTRMRLYYGRRGRLGVGALEERDPGGVPYTSYDK